MPATRTSSEHGQDQSEPADPSRPIVAIGERTDAQFRLVVEAMQATGSSVVLIDIHEPIDFALRIDTHRGAHFYTEGALIEPLMLWYRLKFLGLPFKSIVVRDFDGVRRTEWLAFATGISLILGQRTLHSESFVPSFNKLSQLVIAAEVGFRVPATVSGVGRGAVERFVAERGRIIIKGLHATNVLRDAEANELDSFITTELSQDEIRSAGDGEFLSCPYFVQELVDNSNEHRVIAFGDEIYCYRLVDPDNATPFADRRIMKPTFELVETPAVLPSLISKFFKLARLRYGVFDLIFQGSEIIFLECNPEGQWHSANDVNLAEVVAKFATWSLQTAGVAVDGRRQHSAA